MKNLLVLDDEKMIQEILYDFFSDMGYGVFLAGCGQEALDILQRERIDYCAVDLRLPDMTGFDFILKASEICAGIRTVIFTGNSEVEIPESVRSLGIGEENIITKPVISLEHLRSAIIGKTEGGEN